MSEKQNGLSQYGQLLTPAPQIGGQIGNNSLIGLSYTPVRNEVAGIPSHVWNQFERETKMLILKDLKLI